MVYSSSYPILVTIPPSDPNIALRYSVSAYIYPGIITATRIFDGAVFPIDSTSNTVIDIAPIVRKYLNTWYEKSNFLVVSGEMGVYNNQAMVLEAYVDVVTPSGTLSSNYTVKYDYNIDYVSQLDDNGITNDLIDSSATPNQIITLTNYIANIAIGSTTWTITNQNGTIIYAGDPVAGIGGINTPIWLGSLRVSPGETLTVTNLNGGSFTIEIIPECRNWWTLYYVNKKGGLDWLPVHGLPVESYSTTRTQGRFSHTGVIRQDFENVILSQDIVREYDLTTRQLDKDSANKLDNALFTPKAWIFNPETGSTTSVIPTVRSYDIKTYPRENDLGYTFRVRESQNYYRR